MKCPECGSFVIFHEYEFKCSECGLVVAEERISCSSRIRHNFQKDFETVETVSLCSMLGCKMDCKKHRNFAHLERLDRILFADRHLANNLLNVRLVCSLLNLEYPVRESIAYCLRKKLRTISNIKNRLTLQVACVYSICKKFNLPITLDTIIQLYYDIGFYVNSRLISRQLRSFNLRTNTKTTPFTQRMAFVSSQISDLLAHIRNQSTTELKSKLIIQAEMILNQMQKRFIAGAPKIIAGGVVAYIFAENQIMKKYQVAHALKISQSYIYSLDHRIRLSIKA